MILGPAYSARDQLVGTTTIDEVIQRVLQK
jgi:hypothetical protein